MSDDKKKNEPITYDYEPPRIDMVNEPNTYLKEDNDLFTVVEGAKNQKIDPLMEDESIIDLNQKECDITWKTGSLTLKDYLALPSDRHVELIDGIFYDMASPNSFHGIISSKILYKLANFIEQNGGACHVLSSPFDVQLDSDDKTIVVPDIFVVCDITKISLFGLVGAPDLIIEIVSPSNWKLDVFKKRAKYEHAGVREYWLIFPKQQKVRVHLFESGEVKEYTFSKRVPVSIWNGRCILDFAEIWNDIRFLYDLMEAPPSPTPDGSLPSSAPL